jgi:starvation-inducible DNA-binding protein
MKHRTKKSGGTLNVYKTENDIPQELRLKLNVLANQCLADAVDLQMQIKQAHWNVKGPHFIGLQSGQRVG